MDQPGAPPAAWQGPQVKTEFLNSKKTFNPQPIHLSQLTLCSKKRGHLSSMPAQSERNLRHRLLLPAHRCNDVSFCLGELAVLHGCNPFLPDEEAASIAGSPPLLKKMSHLVCESAKPNE